MIFVKGLIDDLNKWLLEPNIMVRKNYSMYLHITRRGITKNKNGNISIGFKFLTILFFILLCFLLEENLSISSIKFNKDHLRMIAERNRENENDHLQTDVLWKRYNKYIEDMERELVKYLLRKWEYLCSKYKIKYTIYGRIWEQEKFEYFLGKLQAIQDIYHIVAQEYEKFKEGYPTDNELSNFFKNKKKELNEFKYRMKNESLKDYLNNFKEDCKKYGNEKKNNHEKIKINKWFCTEDEYLEALKLLLIDYMLLKWEKMCYCYHIRCSLDGRTWEEEKFKNWYDGLHAEIEKFYSMIHEEREKFMKSNFTYEEWFNFYKSKKKECFQLRNSLYNWTSKYLKSCKIDWKKIKI
ncbi:Plasmodium exported protein, unknown function [Plasmodium relictum]|uniref:Plasmodium RESA N-terminal domain-containing protein n=1 Tax=Plasmodium relictum TaxID=85471 RepID=A0A1J1GKP7_PLARL|nr:Plasmodium exported protein, unknown function [Plasmodium relictum]CRG84890.1 Plasmodium exported protein, unknown function [Plasmodium relictum]